jgi:hypothetical protein
MSLNAEEIEQLSRAGVRDDMDLSFLTRDDIAATLTGSTIVTRGRLYDIGQFLRAGNTFNATTTMSDVTKQLMFPVAGTQPALVSPNASVVTTTAADDTKQAPRVSVDKISAFCGAPLKWENWSIKTSSQLGQTHYEPLLVGPPPESDPRLLKRDRELYYMLQHALFEGTANHIVESEKVYKSGHRVWSALEKWYGSDSVSETIVTHYRTKLDNLRLDSDGDPNKYINEFIHCSSKLEAKNEGYTAKTQLAKFLGGIRDEDYDVTVQNLRADKTTMFQSAVERIRQREQEIEQLEKETTSKARRAVRSNGGPAGTTANRPHKQHAIPTLPDWILKDLPSNKRKILIKWRGVYNSEGRHIRPDEKPGTNEATDQKASTKGGGDGDSGANSKSHSENKSKRRKGQKSRRTKTTLSGLDGGSASKVVLKSDDDGGSDSEDDSDSDRSTKSSTKKKKKKAAKQRTRRNPVTNVGRDGGEAPRVVLDEGTEFEVIGGVGWKILEKLSKKANLGGWRSGMDGPSLPIVNAVTAYVSPTTGDAILLGLGAAAFDDRVEQTEALVNTHSMRKNNVTVHNVARRDGGAQRLEIGSVVVELEFTDSEKLLTFPIRMPTDNELESIPIYWLTPRVPVDATSLLIQSCRRRTIEIAPESEIGWEARLAYPPEMITAKTLAATTQLCIQAVEMENRESPRQHRKQRLLPLHPRRLEGRTDSDTFFASIKSIRNFACVQLFFHLKSQFLFVRCMRREGHSHGAYQKRILMVLTRILSARLVHRTSCSPITPRRRSGQSGPRLVGPTSLGKLPRHHTISTRIKRSGKSKI